MSLRPTGPGVRHDLLVDCPPDPRPGTHRRPAPVVAALALTALAAAGLTGAEPAQAAAYGAPAALTVTGATLGDVDGVVVSPTGTAYVLDGSGSGQVLALSASGQVLAVLTLGASSGIGPVSDPQGLALDSTGSRLFIADTGRNRVVSTPLPTLGAAGSPTTAVAVLGLVAGSDPSGAAPQVGPAASSPLKAPSGVAWDASTSSLYIADTGNNQVEKVTGTALTIVAGTGLAGSTRDSTARATQLRAPEDVAVDPGTGDLYIADTGNGAVLRVAGTASTVAATGLAGVDALAVSAADVLAGGSTAVVSVAGGSSTAVATGLHDVEGLAFGPTGAAWVADDDTTPALLVLTPPVVPAAAVRITSAAPTSAVKGIALSRAFTAVGSPAPTWSFVGPTPTCLGSGSIGSASGVLTGTPGAAGTCSFTVRADNGSTHDEQVVSLTVGSVPATISAKPVAVAAQGSATVTWTAPATSTAAGEALTGYVLTPYAGGTAGTPRTLPPGTLTTTLTGLTSGTAYTFTVAATNAFGTAAASPPSTAVVPYGGVTPPPAGLTRVQGSNRVMTAVATSRQLFPGAGSARAVVVASSTSFADSLAGARLASAVGAPLLLTDPLALNAEVATEVGRVLAVPPTTTAATTTAAAEAAGAAKPTVSGTVYVLGGSTAVSADVEAAVKAVNSKYVVTRISGADRYDTAAKIAAQVGVDDPVAGAPLYVASGRDFPDGLAVAALAARTGGVVLLTDGPTMPAPTLAYLQKFDPNSELLVAVGGPAARATAGHGAERAIVGADRYDTARRVAERSTAPAGSARVTAVGLATGDNWPDALAGAAAMGNLRGPLLLTPSASLSPSVAPAVAAASSAGRPSSALVFGGPSVVSTATGTAFAALVTG